MSGYYTRTAFSLFFIIGLLVSGCGGSADNGPQVASVTGTVQFNGKPLEEGTIVFHPTSGRSASGFIKGGKIIEVTTITKGDGAPVGNNKVTVFSTKPDPKDASGMGTISLIPKKYNDVKKSGLNAIVKSNAENTLTFDLKK